MHWDIVSDGFDATNRPWRSKGDYALHTKSQRVALPPTSHNHHLSIRRENQVTNRRGKLVKHSRRRRTPWHTRLRRVIALCRRSASALLDARDSSRSPLAAIVDIHNTTGTTNSHPTVPTKLIPTTTSTKRNNGITDRTSVQPARDNPPLPPIPLRHLAILAGNRHALAVGPPREISDTTSSVDAHLRDPLRRPRVKHIDHAAALPRRADQPDVAAAGRDLEALHGLLLFLAIGGTVDLVHLAGVQVPDVEVAAAAGGEDAVAAGRGEGGGVQGRVLDVQGGEEGVW